ncbi:nitrate/sulfonate/bicarbonate ABC transporter ATP-binding protein [Streptococcus pneumoniae]|nr:nitrate/sulfonate/bicarbonate ABC transporter ATP-binding protein [Streptococcus pneumoniae]
MRQRVALLRTYLFGHKLFLLDEAFSALDEMTKMELHAWYLEDKEVQKIAYKRQILAELGLDK